MSILMYCFLLITFPVLNISKTITQSIALTPSTNNVKGVQIHTALDVIATSNEWNINTANNNNWHLHISMNQSWNFLSNQQSSITLKTYTDLPINTPHKDLIFIFTQNTNKYITSTVKMNNNSLYNGIFPHCTSTNNPENILMATGNINTVLNDGNESRNRKYKLTQGVNYDKIPTNTNTYITNTSPFTIQLINNPINEWSKYIYGNQQCQFEPFSTDYPIDIYISAADIGQIVSINKFEIILEYNETDILAESENEIDTKTTSIQMNENNNKNKHSENDSDSFIQGNTRVIIPILIGITFILIIICIVLLMIVSKQSIENKKADNKVALNINNIEMVENKNKKNIKGMTAAELVLHTATFRNEETSKNYSFESRASFASQLTEFNNEYSVNVAIAQDANIAHNVVNIIINNDNEGYFDNSEDDNEVVLDMLVTAGF